MRSQGISRSAKPMLSASSSAGITTETWWPFRRRSGKLEAPAQSAVGARGGRLRAEQSAPELLIAVSVPDLPHALLGGVSESKAVITAHGKRSNATGQGSSIGRDVHQ